MADGSGAGWPNRNPWPMVAPAATASRACLMVSMPSAMTTASVRSAWARTVLTMWAASTRRLLRPSSMAGRRSSGQATPRETSSALTNRVRGGPSPPRTASVKAPARQAQSSSATRPAR